MKKPKPKRKANVAAKTRKICAALGHVYPVNQPVFPRCQRCGGPLR